MSIRMPASDIVTTKITKTIQIAMKSAAGLTLMPPNRPAHCTFTMAAHPH